jgi:hypothetical protein
MVLELLVGTLATSRVPPLIQRKTLFAESNNYFEK